jgi:hypothetical protein
MASKRGGVDESVAKGPAPGFGTLWLMTTKCGETKSSWGATAYMACANVGLSLGQIAHIKPMKVG